MNDRVVLVSLLLKACIMVILVLPLLQPATGHATYLSGTDIPLIDGARIVKDCSLCDKIHKADIKTMCRRDVRK